MVATLTIPRPKIHKASPGEAKAIALLETIRRKPSTRTLWPDGFDTEVYLVPRWRVFCEGHWNGEDWTSREIDDLVANFKEFVKPRNSEFPFYVPIVNEHHDNSVRYGWTVDCGVESDGWLWVTLAVNRAAAHLLDSWLLDHSSIEFWTGKDIVTAGFPALHDDGSKRLAVLRGVALTGGKVQAVLGQPPAPRPYRVFNQTAPYRSFTARIERMDPTMQPPEAAGGMDPMAILKQIGDLIQQALAGAGGAAPDAAMPADPTQQMTAMVPLNPALLEGMPPEASKAFASLYAQVRDMQGNSKRSAEEMKRIMDTLRAENERLFNEDVKRFVAEQRSLGKISPNQESAKVEKLLLGLKDPEAQKNAREVFTERRGNQLMNRMVRTEPPKAPGDKNSQLSPGGRNREQLLAMTEQGRKRLAQLAKDAEKN